MKKQIHTWLFLWALFGMGCDYIKENERLIPITAENISQKRVFLLEFTDQNCRNCPNATAEIYQLIERFSDTIVVVSIHSNPLPLPLRTQEGNEYEKFYQALDHPVAFVDGGGKYTSHDPQVWGGFIFERLTAEASVTIEMAVAYDEAVKEATIHVQVIGEEVDLTDLNLQLWIIENNVKHWQLMMDGSRVEDYIHNHVFRSSVNGTWGEPFSLEAGETKDFYYESALNAAWKVEDVAIVGFVSRQDTNETLNVQEIKITNI